MSFIKKIFSIISFIFALVQCILFLLSCIFLIISLKDIRLDFKVIAEDIIIIIIIIMVIKFLYKKIFNFKENNYIDNPKQIIYRYICVCVYYLFTKCALEIFDLKCININNSLFITIWMNFLLVGGSVFLYGRTRSHTFDKTGNARTIKEYLKSIIIKNKDAENCYSFIFKVIPIIIYSIILLYYLTRISNERDLIVKPIIYTNISEIQKILILFFNYYPHKLIYTIQRVFPFSMMIYGSILVISSFFNKGKISFERKLYRMFGLILGIIVLSAICYTYLFIVDSGSFADLRINFELSSRSILKVFINLFYFSLATFTTTGYGDITATNQISKNMVLIQMFFQIITITISLGIFFNWKNQEEVKVNQYENNFSIGLRKIYNLFSPLYNFFKEKGILKDRNNIVLFVGMLFFESLFFGGIYFLFGDFFFVKGDQRSFPIFLYFSVTTLSTIGFGDIYPIGLFAKFLVSAQMLINMILVLFGINIINSNGKSNEMTCKAKVLKKSERGSGELELENDKHINIPKIIFPKDAAIGDKVEIKIKKIE